MTIQTPVGWVWDRMAQAGNTVGAARPDEYWPHAGVAPAVPLVRRIGAADLRYALRRGLEDFAANRTEVIFLCLIYPLIGLILGQLASGNGFAPMLFPLASGFVLIGPFAAVGLNEMSRRRELGEQVSWTDAFGVLRSPAIGAIVLLGLLLIAMFLVWMVAASVIYNVTLGPLPPVSLAAFAHDVFATGPGWAMIALGVGVGFLFAVAVLAVSVVSFPLLLDQNVRLDTAVSTSIHVVTVNPGTMALWGLIIAGALVLGSIPFLVGLVVVLPVLGHATWHLYRRVVPR